MSAARPRQEEPGGALRRLWDRAPAWRFLVMLALLSTTVFVLFPPQKNLGPTAGNAAKTTPASYTPPPAAPAAASPPSAAANAPVLPTPAPQTAVVQAAPPLPPRADAHPAQQPPAPVAAKLSLATPGPAPAANSTGLDNGLVGRLFSGTIQQAGFTFPLPPGQWAMLATMRGKIGDSMVIQYALGRIENRKLTACCT